MCRVVQHHPKQQPELRRAAAAGQLLLLCTAAASLTNPWVIGALHARLILPMAATSCYGMGPGGLCTQLACLLPLLPGCDTTHLGLITSRPALQDVCTPLLTHPPGCCSIPSRPSHGAAVRIPLGYARTTLHACSVCAAAAVLGVDLKSGRMPPRSMSVPLGVRYLPTVSTSPLASDSSYTLWMRPLP